jgi:hypothetical protein
MIRRASGLSAGRYPVPNLDLNYAASRSLSGIETFTRASSSWAFNSAGVLTQYAANTPRFDYDPVTLAPRGLLIEEQRTNLFLRSADFLDAAWSKTRVLVSANATAAPDGTTAASKIVETAAAGSHLMRQGIGTTTTGQTFTTTLFAKAAERSVFTMLCAGATLNRSAHFNLSTGTVTAGGTGLAGSHSITPVGNGWYRCEQTFVIDSGGTAAYVDYRLSNVANPISTGTSYTGDGVSSLYLWGAQLEAAPFATSYIPTTSASVTRAADACGIPISAFGFNANEWSILVEAQYLGNNSTGGGQRIIQIDDGTNTNRATLFLDHIASAGRFAVVSSPNNANVVVASGLPSAGETFRISGGYAVDNVVCSYRGASSSMDGTVSPLAPLTTLRLGANAIGTERWNGCIRRVAYFPRRLDNATLGRITS